MTVSRSRRVSLALLASAFSLPALNAFAQSSQSGRPMRVILPVSAGSGVDTIVRAVSPELARVLGQPVVVENLPGAGGIIGTSAIVKAPPDGLHIGVVSNNHVTNPSVYKSLPYDSLADITPISVIGSTPFVLVVNPQRIAARNVEELVATLKAEPGVYNYASSGNGTIIHLAGAMFVEEAGVQVTHVPYKGVGPMITDLIGGQVEMGVIALPAVQAHLASGALRAIGLCGTKRSPKAPDLPTIAEQGLPNYQVAGWFAAVGPAGLPAPEVKRIHDAVAAAFTSPESKQTMAKQGNEIDPSTPEEARAFFGSEIERYAALAKKAGIRAE